MPMIYCGNSMIYTNCGFHWCSNPSIYLRIHIAAVMPMNRSEASATCIQAGMLLVCGGSKATNFRSAVPTYWARYAEHLAIWHSSPEWSWHDSKKLSLRLALVGIVTVVF